MQTVLRNIRFRGWISPAAPIVQSQPVVRVLDFGEAPHQEIRYSFTEGEVANVIMSMTQEMSMGGQEMSAIGVPTIEISMSLEATEVLPDGSVRYEQRTNGVELVGLDDSSPASSMMQQMVGQLTELTSWSWVDQRGQALDAGFELPEGTNPMIAQLMDGMGGQVQQMAAPFPAEPVGVGARWEVEATVQMAGAVLPQTSQYELLSRDGDTITLGVTYVQRLDAQNLPPAATADTLAALGDNLSEGSATMTVNLNSISPELESSVVSSMAAAGQEMQVRMLMSVRPAD